MKKMRGICLLLVLLFSLAACGKSPEEKWQEQYELGMKYVSEGNYEEAIIAFEAAIEIDPKRADTYLALADVYEAQGDTESLQAILEQGLEATGVERFQERLEQLKRTLPYPVNMMFSEGSFVEYTSEMEAALEPTIQAGLAGSREEIEELFLGEVFSYLMSVTGGTDGSDYGSWHFWTISDKNVLIYCMYVHNSGGGQIHYEIGYRPMEGKGFTYSKVIVSVDNNSTNFTQGNFQNYMFDGPFMRWKHSSVGEHEHQETTEGNAKAELIQGETETKFTYLRGYEEDVAEGLTTRLEAVTYKQYEEGHVLAAWTDADGRPCTEYSIATDGTEFFSSAGSDGDYVSDRILNPEGTDLSFYQ